MRRFFITVLVATILHAVACIIARPFEFGHNRAECFFFAFVSGLLGFPVMFAVVLLPLRWGLRRFIPHRMQRTQASVAGLVLLGLATAWVFTHPTLPFQHGFYVHWLFWSTVAIAVTISFFCPIGARATVGGIQFITIPTIRCCVRNMKSQVGVPCKKCGFIEYFSHEALKAKTAHSCAKCGGSMDLRSAQKGDALFLRRYGLNGQDKS